LQRNPEFGANCFARISNDSRAAGLSFRCCAIVVREFRVVWIPDRHKPGCAGSAPTRRRRARSSAQAGKLSGSIRRSRGFDSANRNQRPDGIAAGGLASGGKRNRHTSNDFAGSIPISSRRFARCEIRSSVTLGSAIRGGDRDGRVACKTRVLVAGGEKSGSAQNFASQESVGIHFRGVFSLSRGVGFAFTGRHYAPSTSVLRWPYGT
jgi:hypothetical protein